MNKPLIIGITGGIGSGKTTLSENLRKEGYDVYDSDLEARRLQNENPVIRKKLIELFGKNIYTSNELNRSLLAKIVFGNKDLLLNLNQIVHPVVEIDFKKWISARLDYRFLFIESAILFESGFNLLVDKVVLVSASEQLRIKRIMKRDNIGEEQIKARMSNQLLDKDKIPLSDFVIYTDDNLPMADKVRKLLIQLSDI